MLLEQSWCNNTWEFPNFFVMPSLIHLCVPICKNPTDSLKPSKPCQLYLPNISQVGHCRPALRNHLVQVTANWAASVPPDCHPSSLFASDGLFSQQQPEPSIENINHVTVQLRRPPTPLRTAPIFSFLVPAESCLIGPLPPPTGPPPLVTSFTLLWPLGHLRAIPL